MMEADDPKAAITADSRRYNVFTFLEGESVDDVIKSADHAVTSAEVDDTAPDVKHESEVNDTAESPSPERLATAAAEVSANGIVTSSPMTKAADDVADLEFKVDTCQESDSESPAPTAKRKIIPSTKFDLDLTLSPSSSLPDLSDLDGQRTPDDLDDVALSDLHDEEHANELSDVVFGPALDWEDSADAEPMEPIPEYIPDAECENNNKWHMVQISDRTYRIDMESIGQYKKVLSHGGYYGDGLNTIIVFTACYLPEKTISDYHYIMDNLFLYVMSTLELLVLHDYMIVYFHSAMSSRRRLPGIRWFKRCYDMIDRRIRKNLRGLLVVHPTLFLKTILLMMKPFVSSKFSAKVQYVTSLAELTRAVPTEYIFIPEEVLHADHLLNPAGEVPVKKFVNH